MEKKTCPILVFSASVSSSCSNSSSVMFFSFSIILLHNSACSPFFFAHACCPCFSCSCAFILVCFCRKAFKTDCFLLPPNIPLSVLGVFSAGFTGSAPFVSVLAVFRPFHALLYLTSDFHSLEG